MCTFVLDTVKNKSWLADDGVGVVSHVFTTNDGWLANSTLCSSSGRSVPFWLCSYPRGELWGQMAEQTTSCSPCLHFLFFQGLSSERATPESLYHVIIRFSMPFHVFFSFFTQSAHLGTDPNADISAYYFPLSSCSCQKQFCNCLSLLEYPLLFVWSIYVVLFIPHHYSMDALLIWVRPEQVLFRHIFKKHKWTYTFVYAWRGKMQAGKQTQWAKITSPAPHTLYRAVWSIHALTILIIVTLMLFLRTVFWWLKVNWDTWGVNLLSFMSCF